MNKDVGVQQVAVKALHIISLGYIFFGIGMVLINAFNGAGDTRTPTIINIFCFWAFQIPLAYGLSIYLDLGPTGVYVAILLAEAAVTIIGFLVFRRGRWKKVKI